MEPFVEPWNKKALTQEEMNTLYREWGIFYTLKQKVDLASHYFKLSLGNDDNDSRALYNRSRCKRNIAESDGALLDAMQAVEIDPVCLPYNLEVCDALYQLNRFEETKINIEDRQRIFGGINLKGFLDRNDAVCDDFNSSLGESMGLHISESEPYFYKSHEKYLREVVNMDNRPKWKIRHEQKKCDVLSVNEEQEEIVHPRQVVKEKLSLNSFMQIYLQKSWKDLLFIKTLKNHPSIILPQSQWTTPLLKDITHKQYKAAFSFMKMLHARCPLYEHKYRKTKNLTLHHQRKEKHLFRIQYQVHRTMMIILKRSINLKKMERLQKLTKYVEEVMGEYVILKTQRIMPWKFEFINEIYNILALAILDYYLDIPKNYLDETYTPKQRLLLLLKMPLKYNRELPKFEFGVRSTFQDPDMIDLPLRKHRKFVSRMEKRLMFSEHHIERAYLYHEIARGHFKHALYETSSNIALKGVQESQSCKSYIWTLIGLLMVCKSQVVLHKDDKVDETLAEATEVAKILGDDKVKEYINLLSSISEEEERIKKIHDECKSKMSMMSFHKNNMVRSSVSL